jgi:hypothetical protein
MQIKYPLLATLMTLSLGASAQSTPAPAAAPVPPATAPALDPAPAPTAAPQEPVSTTVVDDQAQPAYDSAPAEPPPEPEQTGRPHIQKQASLYMGSPIWLSDAPLDPGFEFELRQGIRIGSFVPEMGFGSRWNWVNVDKLSDNFPEIDNPELFKGENLNGFWLSLGLRIEPEMRGKLQPYFSVAFDANMWGASFDRHDMCGFFSCVSVRTYDFAPGFSGRVGLRFAPKPFIGLDIGAKPAMSFKGWAFEKTQSWIEPFGGLTIIMDPAPQGGSKRGRR